MVYEKGDNTVKLRLQDLKDSKAWAKAGIDLPSYDVEKVVSQTKEAPRWAHFGIGNIFRIFIGGIADQLLEKGMMQTGITCVETYDFEVVDKIYRPYDNLAVSVILKSDGTRQQKVLGSLAEAVKGTPDDAQQWERLKEVFRAPSLQIVSCTITEKGYALTGSDGEYLPYIKGDIEKGPGKGYSAMSVITSMLLERFEAGAAPLALVSMDNCAHNGENFRNAVLRMAGEWKERGYVGQAFLDYIGDEKIVSFPWTMIDKITPRPAEQIANDLERAGLEDMQPVMTQKKTFIAPFINAEGPQYLVIEDSFPNGRPALDQVGCGVYLADRVTVNKAERMKVTACLNPIHSGLGTYGCVLGYTLFSDQMEDEDSKKLALMIGEEGMVVVPDPGILSPRAFLEECLYDRFPNPYLGDTVQRLTVDISQGVSVRFGETVKAYVERFGSASRLEGICIAIAGYLRYLMAVDDQGVPFELNPDPMNEELHGQLASLRFDDPSSLKDQAKPILSNARIWGVDLYEAGIGEKIEAILREMLEGPGAVRRMLHKHVNPGES